MDRPLPSLDHTDSMLLLNQHGELSDHLKYVFTLQDDVPLWRGRATASSSEWFQCGGSASFSLGKRALVAETLGGGWKL